MISINRSLTGLVAYVSANDPAVKSGHDEFRETNDLSKLVLEDGQKPTVFHLKPLSRKRMEKIASMKVFDLTWSAEQLDEAVAYGLKKVENLEVNGRVVELEFEKGEDRLKPSSLDAIFSQLLFLELGRKILDISDLSF